MGAAASTVKDDDDDAFVGDAAFVYMQRVLALHNTWRAQYLQRNILLNGAMAEVDLALRTIQGSGVIHLENENESDERPDVAVGYDRRDEAGVVIRNVLSFLSDEGVSSFYSSNNFLRHR